MFHLYVIKKKFITFATYVYVHVSSRQCFLSALHVYFPNRSKLKDKLDSFIKLSQCLGSGKYGRFLQRGKFETLHRKFVGRFFFLNSNKEFSLQKGVASTHTQGHPKKPLDLQQQDCELLNLNDPSPCLAHFFQ